MSFLSRLLDRKKPSTENDYLNEGLKLATLTGKHFLEPIQKRLGKKYKSLTVAKLDEYEATCTTVVGNAIQYLVDRLHEAKDQNTTIPERELNDGFYSFMHDKYEWITHENLKALLKQSYYFAWRDGLHKFIQ